MNTMFLIIKIFLFSGIHKDILRIILFSIIITTIVCHKCKGKLAFLFLNVILC